MVGLGVGPPCLRVGSEETLLTLIDERAQLARAAPGVTPVDSSENQSGNCYCLQFWESPWLIVCRNRCLLRNGWSTRFRRQLQPLEQVHYVVSGDVDFDSFGMVPWDAGGMHGDSCQLRETMMLHWLMRLLCRPVIMNGLDKTMRMNMENDKVKCFPFRHVSD